MVTAQAPTVQELPPERLRQFDLSSALLAKDFHKALNELQREAPDIFYTHANGGHWVIVRQELLAKVLQDGARFSSIQTQLPLLPVPQIQIPLHLDPPQNMPYRKILMQYFSRAAVERMEPRVREMARDLVAAIADTGRCEFIGSVAMPLPVKIFIELAGFDPSNIAHFRNIAVRYLQDMSDIDRTMQNIGAIAREVANVVAQKRITPSADLISDLLKQQVNGRALTDQEIHSMCFLLFVAGLDTVVNAATFLFLHLAQSPDRQEFLRSNPTRIPDYVEECFRMFGVVSTVRTATADVDLDGVRVRAGEPLLCILPLAGMDNRVNPNPESFQIDRKDRTHMLFGGGVHLCLGHLLARLEIRVLIEEWLGRVPSLRLQSGFVPVYQPGQIVSLASLELQWN